MSLELSPDKFEIRSDVDDSLILSDQARLVPIVHRLEVSNLNVVFPNPTKAIHTIMRSGIPSSAPDDRAWRSYAWCLRINAGTAAGYVVVGTVPAELPVPNFLLAMVSCARTGNPQTQLGPFEKATEENKWLTVRSGMRLEYNAWIRRVAWLSIVGREVRLNWKQSARNYQPNQRDTSQSSWPSLNYAIDSPPGYRLGFAYERSPADTIFPPDEHGPTNAVNNAMNAVNFTSTWRFQLRLLLLRL